MKAALRGLILDGIAAAYHWLNKRLIFRYPAQNAHDTAIDLLRLIERVPLSTPLARLMHRLTFPKTPLLVGGVSLSQRLILAAGLVKGQGFATESEALHAVTVDKRNVIPGWRIVPALLGPVEFGSFTRHPRLGNDGAVIWRHSESQSTQNRVGLRNPGARAAARFLADRRRHLPAEFGVNIAVSPGVHDIDQQEREVLEALSFFLDAGVAPSWFTLNISCPNTEDDPRGHQLKAETKQLCRAAIAELRFRALDIPLWVKISPALDATQYRMLVRIFAEVGVSAIIATNTLAQPSPPDASVQAGFGGGALFNETLIAIRHLRAGLMQGNYSLDLIACGGILDGASFRQYQTLGVKAGQYWSASSIAVPSPPPSSKASWLNMTITMKQSIAKALLDIGAVGFSPESPITFKSGLRSPVYVDNRALIYHPAAWHHIIDGFSSLIKAQFLACDVIAGVAVGGVPHSSALAFMRQKPSVFIRKESKGHGKGQRIEGGEVAARKVLLIEDLVTTGGSSLSAVEALIAAGAQVADVLAIISYGFSEASTAFDRAGLQLHTLTDFATVLEQARQIGTLDNQQIALISRWFADPYRWSQEST